MAGCFTRKMYNYIPRDYLFLKLERLSLSLLTIITISMPRNEKKLLPLTSVLQLRREKAMSFHLDPLYDPNVQVSLISIHVIEL